MIRLYKEKCAFFLLSLGFVALTLWSWRKLPDIVVDFGRELYIPWQLLSGKVLFEDIAHFSGPVSPYFNALIFYLFGASLTTLMVCNLVIVALLTIVIYSFFKRACDQFTALFSCMVFLSFFAFAHFTPVGNYNWICPYSHELTHGITLSCVMLLLFQRCAIRMQSGLLALAGVCFGFILLTKVEVSLAATGATIVGIALINGMHRPQLGRSLTLLALFLAGVLIPVAGCFFYLRTHLTSDEILWHIFKSWHTLMESPLAQNRFYLVGMGLDMPLQNLTAMGLEVLGLFMFIGAAFVYDRYYFHSVKHKLISIILFSILIGAAAIVKRQLLPCLIVGRSLTLVTLIFGGILVWLLLRWHEDLEVNPKLVALIMWAVFAFLLLGKIFLAPRIFHYGFALAMPAGLLLVAFFLWFVPERLRSFGGTGAGFRRLIVIVLVADILFAVKWSNHYIGQKTFSVGHGGDRIITYRTALSLSPAGPSIAEIFEQIELLVPPEGNFVVVPEGVMINFLTRRPNPTPYINFMPPELVIYGETNVLESLRTNWPDFIVTIPKDTTEYGVGFFGEDPDYGSKIMTWVSRNYEKVWEKSDGRHSNNRFGISILERSCYLQSR